MRWQPPKNHGALGLACSQSDKSFAYARKLSQNRRVNYQHPANVPALEPAEHTLADVGLKTAGVACGIKATGKPDVALLASDEPFSVAGVFTQNKFPAAPVLVSRRHLAQTGGRARAIVVNSGNANACTGAEGEKNAQRMAELVAAEIGAETEEVLVCSTGVIGVPLPMDKVEAGIIAAAAQLAHGSEAGRAFAEAIRTTDAFVKEDSRNAGDVRIAGVTKGAGMIQPNMATMLAFMATDAYQHSEELRQLLPSLAQVSFNRIHVDTHQSTNDAFFLISSGQKRADKPALLTQLDACAKRLAWLIVRDGEGATKVVAIRIKGAQSDEHARQLADEMASSALNRTAFFGNDPNWGRFVSHVGNSRAVLNPAAVRCSIQGTCVFENGAPQPFDNKDLSAAMAQDDVELLIELDEGRGTAEVWSSDLSYRYVEINGEYTTLASHESPSKAPHPRGTRAPVRDHFCPPSTASPTHLT